MVFGGGAARRGDKPGAMAAHGADTNHHEEASRMLETALQQMDSIIAGTELELAGMEESVRKEPLALSDPVAQAAERLRQAITLSAKSASTPSETALTEETRHFLSTWLAGNNNNSSGSSNGKKENKQSVIDTRRPPLGPPRLMADLSQS
ncbi:hypothetical protein FJT64_001073 [Amphibalanus amphitrite]|uniref:Uncharacterized protein n=1 Tax=Amphibalanus amphitrite TaxID=1232801 RepID=A0A6A4VL51_AMPAM|nr:hypothetical protein FJT64_001073 [Amphibalanus amphitrite]